MSDAKVEDYKLNDEIEQKAAKAGKVIMAILGCFLIVFPFQAAIEAVTGEYVTVSGRFMFLYSYLAGSFVAAFLGKLFGDVLFSYINKPEEKQGIKFIGQSMEFGLVKFPAYPGAIFFGGILFYYFFGEPLSWVSWYLFFLPFIFEAIFYFPAQRWYLRKTDSCSEVEAG